MSVRDYYFKHFDELSPEKKFHFAIRMKNFFKIADFDEYLMNNQPNNNLKEIIDNNDYSRVSNYEARKPFFEKYVGIYGIEAALFRVYHLLKEYNTDVRNDFLKLYSQEKLYAIADKLLGDKEALGVLSTWAINVIYLTEELFPRNIDVMRQLFDYAIDMDNSTDATTDIYFYTHLVLCESDYYKKDLSKSKNIERVKTVLSKCEKVVKDNIDTISLDAAIEFLVCAKMAGMKFKETKKKIDDLCNKCFENYPYIVNYRRDGNPNSRLYTLNGAEHINMLYIMSGLDN